MEEVKIGTIGFYKEMDEAILNNEIWIISYSFPEIQNIKQLT